MENICCAVVVDFNEIRTVIQSLTRICASSASLVLDLAWFHLRVEIPSNKTNTQVKVITVDPDGTVSRTAGLGGLFAETDFRPEKRVNFLLRMRKINSVFKLYQDPSETDLDRFVELPSDAFEKPMCIADIFGSSERVNHLKGDIDLRAVYDSRKRKFSEIEDSKAQNTKQRAQEVVHTSFRALTNEEMVLGGTYDVQDSDGCWFEACTVRRYRDGSWIVHFLNWDRCWDEDIETSEGRFASKGMHTSGPIGTRFAFPGGWFVY